MIETRDITREQIATHPDPDQQRDVMFEAQLASGEDPNLYDRMRDEEAETLASIVEQAVKAERRRCFKIAMEERRQLRQALVPDERRISVAESIARAILKEEEEEEEF